jgi:heat shock protein HtpX
MNGWRGRSPGRRSRGWSESLLLIATLGGLLALCGWVLAKWEGVVAAFIVALFLLAMLRLAPSNWVLSMFGARPVRRSDAPQFFADLDALARAAGIGEAPAVYAARHPLIVAATLAGSGTPAIVVGRKVPQVLTPRELRAVLAHEIAHIANRDLPLMQLGRALTAVTGAVSRFALTLLIIELAFGLLDHVALSWWELAALAFAPIAANLILLALSRSREFGADAAASRLTGDPMALASALVKLDRLHAGILQRTLPGFDVVRIPTWLRTHPSSEERIERLVGAR